MADNTTLPGTGDVIADEDIGGVKFQKVFIGWGPAGTYNKADVASGKAFPVQLRSAAGAELDLSTFTQQVAGNTKLDAVNTNLDAIEVLHGAVNESAPSSDTGASGHNGRLQRIAQRITSFIALLPTALGANGGLKVDVVGLTGGNANIGTNADAIATAASSVAPVGAFLFGYNGTTWDRIQLDANKYLKIAPQAGELHLGEVGGKSVLFPVTLSLDTSAYASGDVLADTQVMTGFFRKVDGTGVINSIQVIDQDDQKAAFDIYFLIANVAMGTENSAPSISDANAANVVGPFSIATTDYKDLGGVSVATLRNLGQVVKAATGTSDLYVAAINGTGTPTYTAAGVKLAVGGLLD